MLVFLYYSTECQADHAIYRSRDNLDMTYQDTGIQLEQGDLGPLKSTLTETAESFNLPTIDQKTVTHRYKVAQQPTSLEPLARENTVHYDIKLQYQQDISLQVFVCLLPDIVSCMYIYSTQCISSWNTNIYNM